MSSRTRDQHMRSALCVVFACILALLATPATAQQSNPYVSVSIDSPSAGATFQAPANVNVQVSAFTIDDGVYVSQLQILRSGQVLASGAGESLSYLFNNLPAGSYTVTASAKSNLGGKASTNVTFNVVQPGERPPVISLNPATGQPFIGPAKVYLSANASDPDGQVVRVDYYANGSHIGSSSAAGFGFTWNNAPPGNHQVTGVAVDNNGKTTTSGAILVVVEQSVIRGNLDGINEDSNGLHHLTGWACSSGRPAAVNVHIYVGGAAGTGQFIGEVLANQASEPAVAAACQSNGSQYRFRFTLTNAIRQAHANKLIYVHGISPAGASNSLLAGSGVQRIPAPLRVSRRYVYDTQQRLCKTIEPESGSTVMSYDGAGNLVWSASGLALPDPNSCDRAAAEASGRVVRRTYDKRNRLATVNFPDGRGNQSWTYTPIGLPDTLTADNDGTNIVTTRHSYNRRGLLTEERMLWSQISWPVGYTYNSNGHISAERYPNGQSVNFAPNALGQPTQAGTFATGVSYHPNGAIKQFTYGNGIVHTMTQNTRQLPIRSTDCVVVGCTAAADKRLDLTYGFDKNANVSQITDNIAGRQNRSMVYDGLDRVTSTTSAMFGTATYAYDVLDNLIRVNVAGGSAARNHFYCYDTKWQLTNVKTGSCSGASVIGLGYDVQGNLNNKNGKVFDFDFGNRLRGVNGIASYVYDVAGRRVRDYTTASKYSLYAQDGRLMYSTNGRLGVSTQYVYLGGSLVAFREAVGTVITPKYQHTDALGSPITVTGADKAVLERSEYEPYGQVVNATTKDGPGFTGHVLDAATGMNYMQQRYYDPQIGRFLSVDPVTAYSNPVGAFNRYWYANNNPYKFTDPDGRESGAAFRVVNNLTNGGPVKAPPRNPDDKLGPAIGVALTGVLAAPAAGFAGAAALANPATANTILTGAADIAMGDAIGGASLAMGAGALAKGAEAAKDFFSGTKYTEKVLGQMKQGDFHAFPESVKAFQESGTVKQITGGDGVAREMLSIPGGYKGREGAFEFIKESDGSINHRKFEPSR